MCFHRQTEGIISIVEQGSLHFYCFGVLLGIAYRHLGILF